MCVAVIGMNIPALALGSSCKVTPQLVRIIFVWHFSGSKGFRHWSLGPCSFGEIRHLPLDWMVDASQKEQGSHRLNQQ